MCPSRHRAFSLTGFGNVSSSDAPGSGCRTGTSTTAKSSPCRSTASSTATARPSVSVSVTVVVVTAVTARTCPPKRTQPPTSMPAGRRIAFTGPAPSTMLWSCSNSPRRSAVRMPAHIRWNSTGSSSSRSPAATAPSISGAGPSKASSTRAVINHRRHRRRR
ncbi:hypothetical protein C1703_13705 [Streptomyces sp. Go-475]|nr:hypothetical protein C1703_13705 [Streptomyces sp. Go-475]